MVTNIRILERWLPLHIPPNVYYLKDILNIPIALGSQLDRDHSAIAQWKQHHNKTIEKMKPYITSTFRILHPNLLDYYYAWLKSARAFKLNFLRTHHESDLSAYYPVY